MPDISIVLPTHNGAQYLSLAIDSVLKQTYENFELIIVDDGSTDNTWEIIEQYAELDRRIRVIRHVVNRNLPTALNAGFKIAAGEFFTWTSDDNILKPQMLEHFMDFFSSCHEADIVYSDYDNIDESGLFLKTMKTGFEDELPIYDNIGASFMYRRKVDEVCNGYDENRFCAEDYAFWLKAYCNKFRFFKLEENLYQYRVHKNSLTGKKLRIVHEQTLDLLMENNKQNEEKIPELIRMRSYLRCVRLAKDLGNKSLAKECLSLARLIRTNADDWTRPELIKYADEDICLSPKIILFGAGKAGVAALKWMRENEIAVSAFVDNNEMHWYREVEGIPVLKPTFLKELEFSQIVITTAYPVISLQLSSMGIENYSAFYLFQTKYLYSRDSIKSQDVPSAQRGLKWILSNMVNGGLKIAAQDEIPYPEVTGYTIPTLLDYGFIEQAIQMAEYLLTVQCEDGAFCGPGSNIKFYFDTAQALRGFLAIEKKEERFHLSTVKAAEWLFKELVDNNGCFPNQYANEPLVPEAVNLFSLPPLLEYAKSIKSEEYVSLIYNYANYLLGTSDALSLSTITHFLAYQIDGLIDIGLSDKVKSILEQLISSQLEDGSIPGKQGVEWVILTGCAQLAICYYKQGNSACANRLMDYLELFQAGDGGFIGSLGSGAEYFPDKEISWAVKFYLDAQRERVRAFFKDNVSIFPEDISPDDGRVCAILDEIKTGDVILDAGCGKGRILRRLMEAFPENSFTALDLSGAMLDYVPKEVVSVEGVLENIPLSDNVYDVTYCVEAIEHSSNPTAVVRELVRVTKKGGIIIIIDKQAAEWGRMKCPPWESWPEREVLENLLNQYCHSVKSVPVRYESSDKNDDLIIKWIGVKKE